MKQFVYHPLALMLTVGLSLPFYAVTQGTAAEGADADSTANRSTRRLKVAVAQISVTRDLAANVDTINRAIDRAAAEKADVLLTPEGSLSGYTPQFDQAAVNAALEKVVKKASSAGLALALGTCFVESDDQRCYNQIRFYDADGTFLGFHSKTLRCGSMTDHPPKGEINDYAARPPRRPTRASRWSSIRSSWSEILLSVTDSGGHSHRTYPGGVWFDDYTRHYPHFPPESRSANSR